MIEIDGLVKGAALSFKSTDTSRSSLSPSRPTVAALPGVAIGKTGLKIVGKSDAILAALDTANRIAGLNEPALIEGQTGVGKELFARLIQARFDPTGSPSFRSINCSAMTPQMFESALIQPPGPGSSASICFDEIGEASAEIQLLLLRVIEDYRVRLHLPDHPEPSLRVLSLTNRVMLDEVAAGRFRRDLFYRLSTVILTIPPLTERGEDVLLIAEHYNRKISLETGRELLTLGSAIQDALMAYTWPGNVRELRNLMASLHGLAKSRVVALADLPESMTAQRLGEAREADLLLADNQRQSAASSLKYAELRLIENTLRRHHGNLSKAALSLGISRPTLYRKIETYGIRTARGDG